MHHNADNEFNYNNLSSPTFYVATTINSTYDYAENATVTANFTLINDETCVTSSSSDFLSSHVFQTFIYLMYSIVFIVALIGNGLVCFVVQTSPRMKTVTNYFIANLAIGDILMTLFCVPFSFVSMLVLRYWPFGEVMCKIVNYSQAVSVMVSAYTLLAISIDRYMVIMYPLRPRLGKTSAKLVIAGVWGGALATAAPIPAVSQVQRPTSWHSLCERDICLEQWDRPEESEQYTYALLLLQFILPLCALVWTYGRIAYVVWGGRPPGEAQSTRDTRLHRSKLKMVKMMVTVVTVFIMCWLPLNLFIILWTMYGNDIAWATWPGTPYLWFASHWLAMSHSCYNPIIYCYMNNRYRRGFQQVLDWFLCTRTEPLPRRCHRYSLCDGIPMTDMVGANALTPRLTSTSCSSRLHRGPTCSSCSSGRRHLLANVKTTHVPIRALSVRNHYNQNID